jgi:hypothetical protein
MPECLIIRPKPKAINPLFGYQPTFGQKNKAKAQRKRQIEGGGLPKDGSLRPVA